MDEPGPSQSPDGGRATAKLAAEVLWVAFPGAGSGHAGTGLAGADLRIKRTEDLAEAEGLAASGRYQVALVDLAEAPSPDAAVLRTIRTLKAHDVTVLACGDRVGEWPVRARCLPLLAGACQLLECTRADFGVELKRRLGEIREARDGREQEERQVRETMRRVGLVGESPALLHAFRQVMRMAVFSDLATLVTGETGTGKELIAHALHRLDPKRCRGPFVALNCAALTPTLAESELFGHRRGAFTGAERDRLGLIRAAHGGVLFLDEIGDLDLALQAKLLRVLQANRVLSVGEEREVAVSVRIVAATNRDLKLMVEEQRFRPDLYHRLGVLSVHLPPLRERPADIAPLVRLFLGKYAHLRPNGALAAGADFLEALSCAALPGNVRQLENLICQALINKGTDGVLHLDDLPPDFWQQLSAPEAGAGTTRVLSVLAPAATPGTEPLKARVTDAPQWADLLKEHQGSLTLCLESCERALLAVALEDAQGNQSRTARLLGISVRSVYSKLRKHRLGWRHR